MNVWLRGAAAVLAAPLAWAALLCLAAATFRSVAAVKIVLSAALGAALMHWVPADPLAAAVAVAAAGAIALSAWRPPAPVAVALACALGAAAAVAADMHWASRAEALGGIFLIAIAAAALCGFARALHRQPRLAPVVELGARILGAWMVALSLLLLLLRLR